MTSLKTECRKFSPNIFNKSKCQNCFRGKDAHSSEALESNRATRKVSCCGYLFVAPGWDFSLPANRNKRWQRRWFVLYDDGELAYSVDEHPETVPQAIIDMNCVLEVSDAESVTGNPFALAVTCPDKVHFIKGMSKEESKKWFEVLSKFPRNTVCGKYKRNATFPCIKATTVPKIENTSSVSNNRRETVDLSNYSKHNGYVNSLNRNNRSQSSSIPFDPDDDVFPTKDTNSAPKATRTEAKSPVEDKKDDSSVMLNESNLRNSIQENVTPKSEDIKKYLKREGREARKLHSRSDVSKMIPSSLQEKIASKTDWKKMALDLDTVDCVGKSFHNPVYLLMSDVPSGKKIDSYENFFSQDRPTCLRRQGSFGKKSDLQRQMMWPDEREVELKNRTLHKSASVPNAVLKDDTKILTNGTCKSTEKYSTDSLERSKSSINQVRGDPDGCNLDSLPSYCSSTAEFLADQNTESVFLKKGWLVKQDECKWNKYWFVLRNSALTYYSDPIAEDAGILDGVVDLRKVKSVSEVQSSSGFTFCVLMKDFTKLYLSAVTSKIRNNWIRAILQAANLKVLSTDDNSPKKRSDVDLKTIDIPKDKTPSIMYPDTSLSSIDSEKSLSSSSSKTVVEEEDSERIQDHKSVPLPPSPPLARTAISRVKERARTRSNSRTRNSRFRSSEIHESDQNYLADSDDGTTDQSSSSQHNSAVVVKEKKLTKESSPKHEDKCRPERRRSFKLSSLDSLSLQEGRKKVTDIKDKLEDSSWTIWLDISKFCKEVESKLDDLEEKSPKNGPHLSGEQKKEIGGLVSSLGRVEDRLHKVQNELEKAKTTLLLNNRDNDLELNLNTTIGCHSLKQEVSRLNGISSQNVLLAQQLYKVREENRRLKSEVKNAQASSDDFELKCISLKQSNEQADKLHKSQMELMVARVDDLTNKLLASEKNVRQLRQRVMKLEQRQERRRSSLKGKEAISLSKEYETKLSELEQKIDAVEGVLKNSEPSLCEGVKEKEEAAKESQSLLMRLHNLDRKVKDVTETVTTPTEEIIIKQEDIPKPKIRLQVNLNDSPALQDTSEDWNSLSLSASMTDLTNPDKDDACEEDSMSLSFHDCLDTMGHKMSSLITWLKTTLQLLYAQGHMNPFHASKINFISSEASEELGRLVRVLDHVTGKNEESAVISQDVGYVVGRLLYNIILLQEITNIIFKMSDFEKYKTAVLVQHLSRVRQAILGIEQYIQQKSNPVHTSVQKLSLCNIVACLLFYRSSIEEVAEVKDVKILFEEVDLQRQKVCNILSEFKEKFIERFCTTILELSEDSVCDKNLPKSNDQKSDTRPLGQKQFLSHISHIISQVSQSFITHISKSLNEVYFLCSSFQYSEKWTDYICKLLQQELSLLSSEIKSICIKHLENNFFSSSKCGVLVEYMHCSISELAQIVSIITVVDGTVILIKDAIYGDSDRLKSIQGNTSSDKEAFNTFHESLQVRTMSIMANLPLYRFPNAFFSLCNPNELNVAHRSVSSLLCFKHKWKCAAENERKEFSLQLDRLKAKISELLAEQKRREEEGCRSCIELRQEVSYLQAELDESRALARTGSLCEKCRNLKLDIQHLIEQREKDQEHLEKLEEQEVLWKEHMQEAIEEKELQFNNEKLKLEKELHAAQKNMKLIENQYNEEIKKLQATYEKKLQQKNENVQGDLIKQRYSEEIEQLKSLCERGLAAMDASHKKIVSELESRHQKELEDLMSERERALAEEAHATAVALEAVRKAHSEELQRQVQKFKDEFVLKMNKRFETEAFKKCYESDFSNIKYEILSMTEKYSDKCLENATLQERLEVMTQQLKSTTTQVVELLAKNQQLQAHLTSDSLKKQEELL